MRELDSLASGEYARRVRLRALDVRDGAASVELPVHASLFNRGGRIHGGAIASVVLAAGRLAAASSEREPTLRAIASIDSHVAFLSVPGEATVTARAHVLRRGRDVAHVAVAAEDSGGRAIARAALTCVFFDPAEAAGATRAAVRARPAATGSGGRVAASPYLSAAGVEVLEPTGRIVRLKLPYAGNGAEAPRRVDDGAIAGLVDSCAAFASYLDDGRSATRGGVTVSMSMHLLTPRPEDLLGRAWVLARTADCRVAQVEVSGIASGLLVATGTAVYRIVEG